jgi:hypothetical protein
MRERASNLRRQRVAFMKVETRVGPFSVSTDVETIASLASLAVKAVIGLLFIFWPLMLGQKANGGWHPWVWAIASPWWILVALLAVGHFIRKAEESKRAQGARSPSDR